MGRSRRACRSSGVRSVMLSSLRTSGCVSGAEAMVAPAVAAGAHASLSHRRQDRMPMRPGALHVSERRSMLYVNPGAALYDFRRSLPQNLDASVRRIDEFHIPEHMVVSGRLER